MDAPRFYFALPRLLAHLRGRNSTPAEQDWREANIVGTAIHAMVYLFFVDLLLRGLPSWQQALLLVPLALLLGFGWMVYFCLSSRLLNLLRAMHLLGSLPVARAEGLLLGLVISAIAAAFVQRGSMLAVPGWIWFGAVACDLLAAAWLAFAEGKRAP